MVIRLVVHGYIINHKKQRLIFSAEKLPKHSSLFINIFRHHTWAFNFDIPFRKGEKLKSNIHAHRFQYPKILKVPQQATPCDVIWNKAYLLYSCFAIYKQVVNKRF